MGRKAKPLQEGHVDLLAKRETATSSETVADEKKKKSYQQAMSDYARSENAKITDEQTTEMLPLVVAIKGERTAVADPCGIWAFRTPNFFRSPRDMILHVIAKQSPRIMAVIDLETFQLRAGVLHHAGSIVFKDDEKIYGASDFGQVKIHRSWSEIGDFVADLFQQLIEACQADPEGSKEAKLYAHNGSNFDFVGFALHLGMDRNTGYFREIRFGGKVYKLFYEITTYAGKSSITIYSGQGKGGKYRLKLIDSNHILTVPLSRLGDSFGKGKTPEQYTDPLKWLSRKRSATTGTNFSLDLEDVRPYLNFAHKKPLSDFEGKLSDEAYEGLSVWKNTLDDVEYTCADVIVLVNALKRFARKFRDFAQPLAKMLGQETVDSLQPFAFNTASTAGFALSAAYWYESRLELDDDGNVKLRRSLQFQQKKDVYALIDGSRGYGKMLSQDELDAELAEGTPIQWHGIVKKGQRAIIQSPVWTTAWDNRFSRVAQNGSQTSVFKPVGHRVIEVDANSAFPAAMAQGCAKRVEFDGYEFTSKGESRSIEGSNSAIACNALIGYEDPGYRQSMPTKAMIDHGIATPEEMVNEKGEPVTMWVVRGRQRILHMLQIRNGEFTCVLPPSLDKDILDIPGTPLRTPGRGLDSRLINARIVRPTILMLRGEYLASYAAKPTVDDDAMVVYLCEVDRFHFGRKTYRDRSRHGPIMGVSIDATGKVFGRPHLPHQKFIQTLYNTRLQEKRLAKEAGERGDLKLQDQLLADAEMTKLIMNGGGYGTYSQNKRPETDFDLGDMDKCIEIIESIAGLDPAWKGMSDCIYKLTPGYKYDYDNCCWGDLYASLSIFREEREAILAGGKKHELDYHRIVFLGAMKDLFGQWADNQIVTFTTYKHRSQELDASGEPIIQTRGIITAAEETAPHAIRPYASAVVAKAAVSLHEGQLIVNRSPFGLAYSDTDSLHIETGIIREIRDDAVRALVIAEHVKRYGTAPEVAEKGLERMMNEDSDDNKKLFAAIMRKAGLVIGDGLGMWGIEVHTYSKGLPISELQEGTAYQSHRTFYMGPKIYVDTDRNNNVARAKVRSVPKINPLQPPVFQGHILNTPNLSDRRGLVQENFRQVKLDSPTRIYFKKDRWTTIESMFASPRRIYPDIHTSVPFELDFPPEIESRILRGEMIRPDTISRALMQPIGVDEEKKNVSGLLDAYRLYKAEAVIKGKSFDSVVKMIDDETSRIQSIIRDQNLQGFFDQDKPVMAIANTDSEEEYAELLNSVLEDASNNNNNEEV